jgi:ribose 5-phosphate isomerase B
VELYIGSDHAGYSMKEEIKNWIHINYPAISIHDEGCNSAESCDYADYAHAVASKIKNDSRGILLCGSANGVSIAANKHNGVRAALCWNEEITKLAREHNDANILSIPARYVTIEQAKEMVKLFFETPFEGGRHLRRVEKIDII